MLIIKGDLIRLNHTAPLQRQFTLLNWPHIHAYKPTHTNKPYTQTNAYTYTIIHTQTHTHTDTAIYTPPPFFLCALQLSENWKAQHM